LEATSAQKSSRKLLSQPRVKYCEKGENWNQGGGRRRLFHAKQEAQLRGVFGHVDRGRDELTGGGKEKPGGKGIQSREYANLESGEKIELKSKKMEKIQRTSLEFEVRR